MGLHGDPSSSMILLTKNLYVWLNKDACCCQKMSYVAIGALADDTSVLC
jgi:hypothetical protein